MTDTGVPGHTPPPRDSHTSTDEWQSFEVRMRRRRAMRCVMRAEVALEAGFVDEARQALDEARQLDSSTPTLDELRLRIPAPSAPVPDDPPQPARWKLPIAAAALMAIAAFAGWTAMRTTRPAPAPAMATRATEAEAPPPVATTGSAPEVMVKTELTRADVAAGYIDEKAQENLDTPPTMPAVQVGEAAAAPPPVTTVSNLKEPEPEPEPIRAPPPAAPAIPLTPLAAASAPPATVPVSVPAPAAPSVDEVARVRSVLAQYENAYTSLDARAAHAVWPEVDERALSRAFGGLQSQQLSLGTCEVTVKGPTARANCSGRATWTPKVGSGRSEDRQWDFTLQNAGGAWRIVSARAR